MKGCENVWVDCSAWVIFTMGAFESTVKKLGAEREVDLIGFKNAVELFKLGLG